MQVRSTARRVGFLAACCLVVGPVRAEVLEGEFQLGGRAISGDTHSSKFEEYRDLEPGLFGNANFWVTDPNDVTFLWGDFENIGYDDQRYQLEAGQWGRFRLFGEYAELPHNFSDAARTLYTYSGSNQLNFPDALRGAIEAVPAGPTQSATRSMLLGNGLEDARRISVDYLLRTYRGGLILDPTEDWEFETAYRGLDRSGRRPFSLGFGSPGSNFANFARPIDEHTNEVTADARYGSGPWNFELGYLGSFFKNGQNQVTVDNPLRLTDSATAGSSQGRISLAPDNSMSNVHATGAYALPLSFPARVATTFSYSLREQDDDFIPHTINSTLAGLPYLALPQDSLDGKVQTYLANVLVTARPLPGLDLRARYRYYDFHNDTPVILFPGHVVNDQTPDDEIGRNVPNDYSRQLASVDASYRFSPVVTVRGGPFWDQWSRSRDREVSRLDEYGAKLAVDLRPTNWALVRADYLFGSRDGTAYHPYDHLKATLDPGQLDDPDFSSVGQLSSLRKFDEANRVRNEIRLLTQLTPREDLDVSFSGGWAKFDYPDSHFGVRSSKSWTAGTEFGYQPAEWVTLSAWYNFDTWTQSQKSRWRPVSGGVVVDDPVNDWNSRSTNLAHTLGATVGFVLVPEKLDLSFSYVFERGVGETHSNGATDCVAPVTPTNPTGDCLPAAGGAADGGNAVNYPDIEDRLQLFTTVLTYHFDENLSFDAMYAFQKLSMQDYRVDGLDPYMPDSNVNGSGGISPSLDVFLGDRWGDYAASIFALSATYRF